jgi:hypothetical protein
MILINYIDLNAPYKKPPKTPIWVLVVFLIGMLAMVSGIVTWMNYVEQ